jgi:hypothetical protein
VAVNRLLFIELVVCSKPRIHASPSDASKLSRTPHYRSSAINRTQAQSAIAANAYATASGRPLNLTLDIHWQWTGFANRNRRLAVAKLLESQRHWLNHRSMSHYHITVRENPPGLWGEHCHLLVHVPVRLQSSFVQHVRKFLRCNRCYQKSAMRWKSAYSFGKLAYLLKGATAPARALVIAQFDSSFERFAFISCTSSKTHQGVINGKRILISQTLGPAARRMGTGTLPAINKREDIDGPLLRASDIGQQRHRCDENHKLQRVLPSA